MGIAAEIATVMACAALRAGNLSRARKLVATLDRVELAVPQGTSALLRAALARHRGRTDHARDLLERAREHFTRAEARHLVAAATFRLGQLQAAGDGESLLASARAEFRRIRVANPGRMIDFLAPMPGVDADF